MQFGSIVIRKPGMKTTEFSRERIISANPLLDYAQKQGWQLKRSGPNFVCVCALHDETTPSFTIGPHKNLWKSFDCDSGGSGIERETSSDLAGCIGREEERFERRPRMA
jgi:hypothetical protein